MNSAAMALQGPSIIEEHRKLIIGTLSRLTKGDWKVLILDATTEELVYNTVKEDDILNQNIANIERIENKREPNPTMDAIYFLSPKPHIVECLLADFQRQYYKRGYLVWMGILGRELQQKVSSISRQWLAAWETLLIDYFPRESHVVTLRDPWSFPILFHPACNDLVGKHLEELAHKIASTCITLNEYPKVRYYKPRDPLHEASVLCAHLARFVQRRLDQHKENLKDDWPPPSSRPQGILLITDRSMDLVAPLIHEFTYQAMVHDLLPLKDAGKVTFHMKVNEGTAAEEETDVEISESDRVWLENRHRHMSQVTDKLTSDFNKFIDENPNFTDKENDTTNLNAIKDMLAGLPQFQQMKSAYSLHINMAQEAMKIFNSHKLPDIGMIEQTMATGLDEDNKKAKNVLEQVVRLLDDEALSAEERLRLVCQWVLFRDGVIEEDIKRLLAHSSLPPSDFETVQNLNFLGAQTTRPLKGSRQPPPPIFPRNTKTAAENEELVLSRYEPALKHLLQEACSGTLDQTLFPYVVPPADPNEDAVGVQSSLRSAAPRWASANRRQVENLQRVLVFVAGGAAYSEARACYEASKELNRDVYLVTSYMLKPELFLKQVKDLTADRRKLNLPVDRPPPRPPQHIYEQVRPPPQQQQRPPPAGGPSPMSSGGPGGMRPPTKALGGMTLSSGSGGGGGPLLSATSSHVSQMSSGGGGDSPAGGSDGGRHRLTKDKDREKKKRNIFGLKK